MDSNRHKSRIEQLEKMDADYQGSHEATLFTSSLHEPIENFLFHTAITSKAHLVLTPRTGLFDTILHQTRHNTMHTILMQPNFVLAYAIAATCEASSIPYSLIGAQKISSTEKKYDTYVRREYSFESDSESHFLSLPPQVWIILDHVRSGEVLKHFLGSAKVDSASITFPTTTVVEGYEKPNPLNADTNAVAINQKEASRRFVSDALLVAGQMVRDQGTLLFCQCANNMNTGVSAEGDDLGIHQDYWQPDKNNQPITVAQHNTKPQHFLPAHFRSFTRTYKPLP